VILPSSMRTRGRPPVSVVLMDRVYDESDGIRVPRWGALIAGAQQAKRPGNRSVGRALVALSCRPAASEL
jgi:hypothetical protein